MNRRQRTINHMTHQVQNAYEGQYFYPHDLTDEDRIFLYAYYWDNFKHARKIIKHDLKRYSLEELKQGVLLPF